MLALQNRVKKDDIVVVDIVTRAPQTNNMFWIITNFDLIKAYMR